MTKILFVGDIHGKPSSPLGRLKDYNEDLFKKLEWIFDYCVENQVKYLVHLGDICDKPEMPEKWKNKFIQLCSKYSGKFEFLTIIGVLHDFFHNREESYYDTCLYNLELAKVIKVLREPLDLGDTVLYPMSLYTKDCKKQIIHIDKNFKIDREYILLAHQFYNWDLDESAGFTKEELETIGVQCSLVLGHDHRQHDTEQVDMVQVFRPGSLMRTELSETMINQKPRVLLYDNHVWSYIEVPHRDITEIYNVAEYRARKSNIRAFKQATNALDSLKSAFSDFEQKIYCSGYLKEQGCPADEFNYLKAVHQTCGQPF